MLRNTLYTLAAAVVLVTGAACDSPASPRSNAGSGAAALHAFAAAMERAQEATYTAEYASLDGPPVVLAQEPPRRAYRGSAGAYVLQPDSAYLCRTAVEPAGCEQAPGEDGLTLDQARMLSTEFNGAVVAPELAQSLIRTSAASSGAAVRRTTRMIAGQPATCVEVARSAQRAAEYRACVTDAGILAWFDGAITAGTQAQMRLTAVTSSVTSGAFALPAGVPVQAVDALD
jgi:hypothetical protein